MPNQNFTVNKLFNIVGWFSDVFWKWKREQPGSCGTTPNLMVYSSTRVEVLEIVAAFGAVTGSMVNRWLGVISDLNAGCWKRRSNSEMLGRRRISPRAGTSPQNNNRLASMQ